eukprot:g56004.t1
MNQFLVGSFTEMFGPDNVLHERNQALEEQLARLKERLARTEDTLREVHVSDGQEISALLQENARMMKELADKTADLQEANRQLNELRTLFESRQEAFTALEKDLDEL